MHISNGNMCNCSKGTTYSKRNRICMFIISIIHFIPSKSHSLRTHTFTLITFYAIHTITLGISQSPLALNSIHNIWQRALRFHKSDSIALSTSAVNTDQQISRAEERRENPLKTKWRQHLYLHSFRFNIQICFATQNIILRVLKSLLFENRNMIWWLFKFQLCSVDLACALGIGIPLKFTTHCYL